MPARNRCANHSASDPRSEYTLLARPYALLFSMEMVSSQELAQYTDSTGPKISSFIARSSTLVCRMMVGPTQYPAGRSVAQARPSSRILAPFASASLMNARILAERER
jgi:hypothetical protein